MGAWGEQFEDEEPSIDIIRSSFLVSEDGGIEHASYAVKPEDTVPNALAVLGA